MHPLLKSALSELSAFGLNPSDWLIKKISLCEGGPTILFESIEQGDFRLKAKIKTLSGQKLVLQGLEVASL